MLLSGRERDRRWGDQRGKVRETERRRYIPVFSRAFSVFCIAELGQTLLFSCASAVLATLTQTSVRAAGLGALSSGRG